MRLTGRCIHVKHVLSLLQAEPGSNISGFVCPGHGPRATCFGHMMALRSPATFPVLMKIDQNRAVVLLISIVFRENKTYSLKYERIQIPNLEVLYLIRLF